MTKRELIASMAAAVYPGIVALQIEVRADGSPMEDATHPDPIQGALEAALGLWERVMDTVDDE